MGKRGPQPKPTNIRILEGDASKGKVPIDFDEVKPPQNEQKCPVWLMKDAKAEWKRLYPVLRSLGLLTDTDVQMFAAYCQAYARWKEAEMHVMREGSTQVSEKTGFEMASPWVTIAQQEKKAMLQFGSRFGMTPCDRRGMSVSGQDDLRNGADPMLKLIGGE